MSEKQADLLSTAEIACEAAIKAGADFADALVETGRELEVEVDKNAINSSDARHFGSISVRAFSGGGTGWWTGSGIGRSNAEITGAEAAALAKVAEPDPDFVSLVTPEPYPAVEGLYDERLAEVSVPEVAKWITQNIDSAREVADDAIVSGDASVRQRSQALANSMGVRVYQHATSASVFAQVVIRRNGAVGSFYEWDSARILDDLVTDNLGAAAAAQAVKHLRSLSMKTATLPVVFGPLAARALFVGLCMAASAEDIQRRRSFLIGRKGEAIASSDLTIEDNPLIPGGLASGVCDGDGYPHRAITIVDRGVLMTYLHSNYTARKVAEENTGHATRWGIAPTNVRPRPGKLSAEEIIREVEDGIYVELGQPSPDTASGQISALVDAGFRIERGELTHPLENTMVAGHALDIFGKIDAISSDYREEPGLIMPTVRISAMRVASAQ